MARIIQISILVYITTFLFYGCQSDPKESDIDGDGIVDTLDKCPDIPGDSINGGCPIIEQIDFIIETSGSMNGYVKGASTYRNIVTNLISKLESTIDPNDTNNVKILTVCDNLKKYDGGKSRFNTKLSDVLFFNGKSSKLNNIFDISTKDLKDTINHHKIVCLVSDCIMSYSDEEIINNPNINIDNASAGLKADIQTVFSNLAHRNVSSAIYAYKSHFDGKYFDCKNKATSIQHDDRPFYIWLFGKENELEYLMENINLDDREILIFRTTNNASDDISLFEEINQYQGDYNLDIGNYKIIDDNTIKIKDYDDDYKISLF
ncbi:MAG: hypothetical protein R2771_06535 [Saprospiraceae bacterium]